LYDFAKANEGELEAKVGDKIRVVDADDGNGWLTVIHFNVNGDI